MYFCNQEEKSYYSHGVGSQTRINTSTGIWTVADNRPQASAKAKTSTNTIIKCNYDYSPYRAITDVGIDQPLQWPSKYYHPELVLTYYSYGHYNPSDPTEEREGCNLYGGIDNNTNIWIDSLGQGAQPICGGPYSSRGISIIEQQKIVVAEGKSLAPHLPEIQRTPIQDGFANQNELNCNKSNANRLKSYVAQCMFVLNPLLGNLGVSNGDWGIGLRELFPDFILDSIASLVKISS